MSEQLTAVDKLSTKIPEEWIKTNYKGMKYISIDKTIKKLNDSFKDNWHIGDLIINPINSEAPGYTCTLTLTICVDPDNPDKSNAWVTRVGVGADQHKGNKDPDHDKMIKTAYANAVKKATNMFGLGAEFWDEKNLPEEENETSETSTNTDKPVVENTSQPVGLSVDAKDLIAKFQDKTKLTGAELSEHLKEYKPESGGDPKWFAKQDNELEALRAFFNFIDK